MIFKARSTKHDLKRISTGDRIKLIYDKIWKSLHCAEIKIGLGTDVVFNIFLHGFQ